jgi:ubiquitin-like 1-activating enzyme E1 A
VRFYAAATYGLYGFIFADLLVHQFVVKRIKSNIRTQCGQETRTRSVIATTETKEGETIWEFVEKEETFCSLADTIGSKVDKKWRPRRRKNVGSILPGIMALWKFQQTFGHLPEGSKEDFKEFTKIMTEVAAELELPRELVKSEFIR